MRIDYEALEMTSEAAWKALREMGGSMDLRDPKMTDHTKALMSIIEKAVCIEEKMGGMSQRGGYSGGNGRWSAQGSYGPDRAYSMRGRNGYSREMGPMNQDENDRMSRWDNEAGRW